MDEKTRFRLPEVREFLADEGATRVHLEALPGYAPDLSPLDQGGWHQLKDVEMANLSCMDNINQRSSLPKLPRRVSCVGVSDEWHVDLAFFLNLGKLGSYPVSPL